MKKDEKKNRDLIQVFFFVYCDFSLDYFFLPELFPFNFGPSEFCESLLFAIFLCSDPHVQYILGKCVKKRDSMWNKKTMGVYVKKELQKTFTPSAEPYFTHLHKRKIFIAAKP